MVVTKYQMSFLHILFQYFVTLLHMYFVKTHYTQTERNGSYTCMYMYCSHSPHNVTMYIVSVRESE